MMILKQIKQFHHDHGMKALITKLRTHSIYLIKQWFKKRIKAQTLDPIDSLKVKRDTLRVNLVLSQLEEGAALIVAANFANLQNIPLRIISRAKEGQPGKFFRFLQKENIPAPQKVEFFSDYDRETSKKRPRLETSDLDIYIATSPETAIAIQGINYRPTYFHLTKETLQSRDANK